MTPYQQGFITKCAERGLTVKQARSLLDTIASNPYYSAGIGALGGGALAGLGTAAFGKRDPDTKKKKYLRNILIGGGLGGLGGLGVNMYRNYAARARANEAQAAYEKLRQQFIESQTDTPQNGLESAMARADEYNKLWNAARSADQANRLAGIESDQSGSMIKDLVNESNPRNAMTFLDSTKGYLQRLMSDNSAATGEAEESAFSGKPIRPGFGGPSGTIGAPRTRPEEIRVKVRRRAQ